MSGKATPGPWHAELERSPYPNYFFVYGDGDPPLVCQVLRGDSIAGLRSRPAYRDDTEDKRHLAAEANARLIAAAPDLLEACKRALPYLANHIGLTRDEGPGDRCAYDLIWKPPSKRRRQIK